MAKITVDGVDVDESSPLTRVFADFRSMAAEAGQRAAVPAEVTNWQARSVLRKTFLPDAPDTSLFTRTDLLLREARDAAAGLPESDPRRMEADIAWQAWEQSNVFSRSGALLSGIGTRFGLTDAQVDDLFRAAVAEVI